MAEIHSGATLTPSKVDLVAAWIGRQRWYAAKGTTARLRRLGAWRLDDPAGEVGVETLHLVDEAGPRPVVYQVPLSYRAHPLPGADAALVGTLEHSVLGRRWVYDATHDPVYAEQLLALLRGQVSAMSSTRSDTVEEGVHGEPHPHWPDELTVTGSRVLGGEQSNTSVIIEAVAADGTPRPVIVKVFRMLAAGENPDVVLQGALRQAGCDRVPAVVGSVTGPWVEPADNVEPTDNAAPTVVGHLAFAQEFLPGLEDAWRVAARALAAGTDFTGPARELGAATAQVHAALASSLGTTKTTERTGSRIIEQMRQRYAAAVAEVPELERFGALVAAVHSAAAVAPWPAMQRIHGDYHLGQVLHSRQRGWVLLDFEGEPLRPLAERVERDQWIRDVAGMLRSIDYAGGSWERATRGSARPWVRATQAAFLDGYAADGGADPRRHQALLTAFELDKAMYELVYEARNRPDWIGIPLAAINRLTSTDEVEESR